MNLNQIGQIAVTVSGLEQAIEFYRDSLGMKFLFKAPPGLAFFDLNGIRLMLARPENGQAVTNSIIYYKVDDITEAHESLSRRGVVFETKPHLVARMPDHELWLAEFRDPDRNVLALMCERRLG